jgi:uncharacterized protein
MPIPVVDTHEFTRRADTAGGSEPAGSMARLVSMLAEPWGDVAWQLSGRSVVGPDGSRRAFLHLDGDATLRLRCVRCLEPVDVAVAVRRDYRLVASESQAEAEDADDEEADLLVASRRFDLASLVEDEVIMALPLAPRHADCRLPAVTAEEAPAEPALPTQRPFAGLDALRETGTAPGRTRRPR